MENVSEVEERNHAPHIALIAVQFMFGSAPVLGKAALIAFPSFAIVGFRVGVAALAFYFLQRFRGSLALERREDYLSFAAFSFFGVVLNQLFFFKGLQLTTATNTSLLAVMIPVFTFLISAVIGIEKLTWRKVLGIVIAGFGVIYLIDPSKASFSSQTTQGDILIILNSLSYAVYVAISKNLISKYGALKSIAWLFLFGSVINVPIGLFSIQSVELSEISLNAWLALAAIIIFPTILSYYWNAWALARVEPSIVAIYVYLQPLIGFFSAVIFLGEKLSFRPVVAMILIFIGVYLVIRRHRLNVAESHITAN